MIKYLMQHPLTSTRFIYCPFEYRKIFISNTRSPAADFLFIHFKLIYKRCLKFPRIKRKQTRTLVSLGVGK